MAQVSAPSQARSRRWWQRTREARIGLAFVAPMLVLFVVFRHVPTLATGFLSLTDYRLSGTWEFEGAENLARLASDDTFHTALTVTLVYALIYVPLTVVIALGTAMMLQRIVWARGFFRSVFFLPYVTSFVLAAVIWSWIFELRNGLINGLLQKIGVGPLEFLTDASLVLPSHAVVSAWKGFGYSMLILLAGLQAIPAIYTEAAVIDGAGPWQRFRYITLPLLKPMLFFVLVLETIAAFQVFDTIYVMTGGGPVNSSYSLVYMLYDQAFKFFNIGYASAVGLVLFVIILVVSLIQRWLLDRGRGSV